jgi:hypothetical protein
MKTPITQPGALPAKSALSSAFIKMYSKKLELPLGLI